MFYLLLSCKKPLYKHLTGGWEVVGPDVSRQTWCFTSNIYTAGNISGKLRDKKLSPDQSRARLSWWSVIRPCLPLLTEAGRATQHSRLGDDLYPDNNGGVGVKCEHRAGQDKYIENQATNTNGQTDFNWTLKAATIPACQVHWGNPTFLRMLINYFTFNAHLQR